METTALEKKLLEKLENGLLDGFILPDLQCHHKIIFSGLPEHHYKFRAIEFLYGKELHEHFKNGFLQNNDDCILSGLKIVNGKRKPH